MTFQSSNYDVIVVGGRCAGAATAMLLARAGVKTLVIERQAYGSDALSTHALMRPAVMQLSRWGLLGNILASGVPVITSTTFHYDDETIPVAIRAEPGVPGLVAPRRTVLDRVLIDAARRAGADVVHDTSVVDLLRGSHGEVCGVVARDGKGTRNLRAPLVIGADGVGSMVARSVLAPVLHEGRVSASVIFGYSPMPAAVGYHWYFGQGLGAGSIPTNGGESCIFVAARQSYYDDVLRFDRANCHHDILRRLAPELADHVDARGTGPLKAYRGRPGFIRKPAGPGWMLVGDAGFFRDPATSHGISDALRDAELAARAVLAGSQGAMDAYQAARDTFAYPVLETTDAVCGFDWTPGELKRHHKRLSEVIKAEIAFLADLGSDAPRTSMRSAGVVAA